ncbi:HEAT repeat domain-containing protein [Singulisphaera rosea]
MSIRGAMWLVAVAGVTMGIGVWAWRSYFSPTHRWIRTIRDPDGGIGRWEYATRALRGRDPSVSPALATSALIDALRDSNWNVRSDAASVLGQGGKKAESAIPALIATLHDRRAMVRVGAMRSLAEITNDGGRGREEVITALIEALNDQGAFVRETAARELALVVKPGDPEADDAISALESRLVDQSPAVRVSASWCLTRLGHGHVCIPALVAALDDSETMVRSLAVATLGAVKPATAEAISAVEIRVRDEDNSYIREEAEKALMRLKGETKSSGR